MVDDKLFNGEYYIQELEDVDAYRYQYGKGCLTDQLLGQFMAQAAGLGYVLPKEQCKENSSSPFINITLKIVWKMFRMYKERMH